MWEDPIVRNEFCVTGRACRDGGGHGSADGVSVPVAWRLSRERKAEECPEQLVERFPTDHGILDPSSGGVMIVFMRKASRLLRGLLTSPGWSGCRPPVFSSRPQEEEAVSPD